MINVVFLLLIFFMVASSINAPTPIDTVPPESRQRRELNAPLTLYMSADGTMALESNIVTLDTLVNELQQVQNKNWGIGQNTPDSNAPGTTFATRVPGVTARDSTSTSTTQTAPPSLAIRADGNLALGMLQPVLDRLKETNIQSIELVTTWVPTSGD